MQELELKVAEAYQNYFVGYQNFWSILSISLTALFTWLFFLKSGFTYIEHLVINAYIFLHTYWLFGIALLANAPDGWIMLLYFGSYIVMMLAVFRGLTGKRWISVFLRLLGANVIAISLFSVLLAGLIIWVVL